MSEPEIDFVEDADWLTFLGGWLYAEREAVRRLPVMPSAGDAVRRARAAYHQYQDDLAAGKARRT